MNETARLLLAVDRDAAEEQIVVPSGVKIAPIARAQGGFYESGAWRFPSPEAKAKFESDLDEANRKKE